MIVATAGHVDHGKTLLVKALTNIDTDRLPEEKKRGLTIDLGFAYTRKNDGKVLGFIDVPGHERFIHNMLSGVGAIDYALLVIAADDGIMPQTHEHLTILDLLGVKRGAVVITKTDKVDHSRVRQVLEEIPGLLRATGLAGSPVLCASGLTGEGVPELRQHLDEVDGCISRRRSSGHFRLAVDRVFNVRGSGLVVTGSAFSGRVGVNDRLVVSPAGHAVRVRGLHVQDDIATQGVAGDRCALNLSGITKDQVARGDWILSQKIHAPTQRIDVRLKVLPGEPRPLRHWTPVHVHLAAAHTTGRIALLGTGQPQPGETAWVQLVLDEPIGTLFGDRVILRDQSARRTIGGGFVVDPFAPGKGRARPERQLQREALSIDDPATSLTSLLDVSPFGISVDRFEIARNLTEEERDKVFDNLPIITVGASDRLGVAGAVFQSLLNEIPDFVRGWHAQNGQQLGPGEHDIVVNFRTRTHPRIVIAALARLVSEGVLVRRGTIVHDPDHVVQLSKKDRAIWEKVREQLEQDGLRAPVLREIADAVSLDHRILNSFFKRAAEVGLVIRVSENRVFSSDTIAVLARLAADLAEEASDGLFEARAYKDRSGIGRNVTIEVLEFFDKAGLTRRVGNKRRLLAQPHEVFGGRDDSHLAKS